MDQQDAAELLAAHKAAIERGASAAEP